MKSLKTFFVQAILMASAIFFLKSSISMEQSNIEKKVTNQFILFVGNEEKRVLEKVDN
jgi:hypothetical protein